MMRISTDFYVVLIEEDENIEQFPSTPVPEREFLERERYHWTTTDVIVLIICLILFFLYLYWVIFLFLD